jgi:hypothetical protein
VSKVEFCCSGCGIKVMKYLSQLKRIDVVFCTLFCRNKNYQKACPDWHPNNYKEYKHICINCNKSFITNGSDFNAKVRSYCSKSCKSKHLPRKPHSEETKRKLSLAAVKQNINYIAKHPYCNMGIIIMMKSSWEVKYAKYLDSKFIKWIYEPEFKLSNGYSYLPDFQLDSGDIIEIKGYMREDAQKKWDLFCQDYPTLKKSLIRKDDLKKLSII